MNIKLNQEVIVVGIGNKARYSTPVLKGIVSKIGRKWFYINCPDSPYMERDEKFSLDDGVCDGKGYSPEWCVYESEIAYEETKKLPIVRREVIDQIGGLNYTQLIEVLNFIKTI